MAIVSKADARGGGASRVACDLLDTLPGVGISASHFCAWSASGFTETRIAAYGPTPVRLATTIAHGVSRKVGLGELVPFELPAVLALIRAGRFDVVHFHDSSASFSPLTIEVLSNRLPTVWTFHDCSPFTGGCNYPQTSGCTRYLSGCGTCSQKGEWPLDGRFDTTSTSWRSKKRLHATGRVVAASPSRWMADLAYSSGLLPERPHVVANMVDTNIFKPADDVTGLRRRLGLPVDRPVLAVSAGNVADPRKGVAKALEAVSLMDEARPVVVLLGVPNAAVRERFPNVETLSTGYVTDRGELREWLAASDAFLFTSTADNQPLSVLESLACGTPVYGWPTGGVPEVVEDGVSGRMIASNTPTELAHRLLSDLSDGASAAMRTSSRSACIDSYAAPTFASAHMALYGRAVERFKRMAA